MPLTLLIAHLNCIGTFISQCYCNVSTTTCVATELFLFLGKPCFNIFFRGQYRKSGKNELFYCLDHKDEGGEEEKRREKIKREGEEREAVEEKKGK